MRIGSRKLTAAISAVTVGGAALAVSLVTGTAHAATTSSISITSATYTGGNNGQTATLAVSVVCPVGDTLGVQAQVTEAGTGTGHSSTLTCSGIAQSVNVPVMGGTLAFAPGQVLAGVTLDVQPNILQGQGGTGPFGPVAGTTTFLTMN